MNKDFDKALAWYELAASAGHQRAEAQAERWPVGPRITIYYRVLDTRARS